MVYIHVPFCRSFCIYCDFYSEICGRDDVDALEKYTRGVCDEIVARRAGIAASEGVDTLYVGGGTPSVLPPSFYSSVLEALRPVIRGNGFREFTVEVNPEDIVERGTDYVRGLISLGVNRFSMGVQSLDDGILRWMNRRHDADGAREAFRILREAGARNISVDVIFGISLLTGDTLRATLEEIVSWGPEHVSAYQLGIEEDSALAAMLADGRYTEAAEEQCLAQYGLICSVLGESGYMHYEISNWARPGFEAVHNSAYWTRKPYVGIGPGAHSFDGRARSWNSRRTYGWTCAGEEVLTPGEAVEEEIMLGLRTAAGTRECLCDSRKVRELLSVGSIETLPEGRIRVPEDRFFVSDDIIAALLP